MDRITRMRIMLLMHAFMFRNITSACVLYLAYRSRHGQRASKQSSSPKELNLVTSTPPDDSSPEELNLVTSTPPDDSSPTESNLVTGTQPDDSSPKQPNLVTITQPSSSSKRWSIIMKMPDQMKRLREMHLNDLDCINNLRMDRNAFGRLCYLLEHNGGLKNERFVSIPEKVAIFLSILAHHKKNTVVKKDFKRSGHTISKYFKEVLKATLKISSLLLVEPQPVTEDCTKETWKGFQGCLGALDGTYIEVRVATTDRPHYRSPNGDTCVNVLGVCDADMNFVYLLSGWEGSATDNQVLRDALNRRHGLKVPTGNYYLCDSGYTNTEGFLAPYSGMRWEEGAYPPQNVQEYFNMKHYKAWNTVRNAFILLKGRWAVLRSTSFYPIEVQNWIILACGLLHNFIRIHMDVDLLEDELLNNEEIYDQLGADCVDFIDSSPAWNNFRDTLAINMFNSWQDNPNL